mmetsp:Transcript_25025/g.28588  ORF Transcript_25025/g.28588 Transcript_25025/m.28588 type:complete len:151 (-) Transcript_25025:290-742(-)
MITMVDHVFCAVQLLVGISGLGVAKRLTLDDAYWHYYLSMFSTFLAQIYFVWVGIDARGDKSKDGPGQITWPMIFAVMFINIWPFCIAFSLYAKLEVGDVMSCKVVRQTTIPHNGNPEVRNQANWSESYPDGRNTNSRYPVSSGWNARLS